MDHLLDVGFTFSRLAFAAANLWERRWRGDSVSGGDEVVAHDGTAGLLPPHAADQPSAVMRLTLAPQ